MALQIRRGTDAQRQALSGVNLPAAGEPLFTTDTRKLFIGDSATAGGVSLTYYDRIAVAGQNTLSAATNTGTLTLIAGSNIDITTDSVTDSVTINAAATFTELQNESIRIYQNNIVGLNSNEDIVMNPSGSGKVDIVGNLTVSGTITGNVTGNLNGNVTGNVTGVAGSITSQANSATTTASSTNTANHIVLRDASGNFSAGTVSAIAVQTDGITIGVGGNINGQGSTIGNFSTISATTFNGAFDGDVTGSVFADNSTTLVDSVAGVLRGTHIGVLQTEKIQISDDTITTLNSNENIVIEPSGTGFLDVRSSIAATRLNLFNNPSISGISMLNLTPTNSSFTLSTIHNSASTSTTFVSDISNFFGPQTGATMVFNRGKGTDVFSPNSVTNNDEIATFDFTGYCQPENGFFTAAKIKAVVDGAVVTDIVPGRLEFLTTDTNGTSTVRMKINSDSITGLVPFKLPVVADDTARTALVPTAAQGMMIFMQSGTSPAATNQAQVFDGTNWVNL